jgi:hypothetical protein
MLTMPDDRLPPFHPTVEELSGFLDHALAPGETTVVTEHLDECLECAGKLDRLSSARDAVREAGLPLVAPGALESALAAALSTAQPVPIKEVAAAAGGPLADASDASDLGRRRALRRQRHVQVLARAAAAVLVLGAIGGGVYGVVRSGNHASASRAASLPPSQYGIGANSTTSVPPNAIGKTPPFGDLALQLRAYTGAASCSKATAPEVIHVDGRRLVVNPPAPKALVTQLPASAGHAPTCVAVGPAFATLWTGDVSGVTIEPVAGSSASSTLPGSTTAHGDTVDLVVALAASADADAPTLNSVINGKLTVEVMAQGVDVGEARVTKGPVVVLPASRSVATSLRDGLLGQGGSGG